MINRIELNRFAVENKQSSILVVGQLIVTKRTISGSVENRFASELYPCPAGPADHAGNSGRGHAEALVIDRHGAGY